MYDLGVMRYNKNCDAKSDTLGDLFCILFICKNSVADRQKCTFSKYKLINLKIRACMVMSSTERDMEKQLKLLAQIILPTLLTVLKNNKKYKKRHPS